jgi:hypothetical protein
LPEEIPTQASGQIQAANLQAAQEFPYRHGSCALSFSGGAMAQKEKVGGEGSYSGSKDYNERTASLSNREK